MLFLESVKAQSTGAISENLDFFILLSSCQHKNSYDPHSINPLCKICFLFAGARSEIVWVRVWEPEDESWARGVQDWGSSPKESASNNKKTWRAQPSVRAAGMRLFFYALLTSRKWILMFPHCSWQVLESHGLLGPWCLTAIMIVILLTWFVASSLADREKHRVYPFLSLWICFC